MRIAKSCSKSFQLLELGRAYLDELQITWSLWQGVHRRPHWRSLIELTGTMLCLAQIWEIFIKVENYGERGGKRLRMEFFNEVWRKEQDYRQASWAVNSADTDTCLQVNPTVDSRHLELLTAISREQRLSEFGFGCWQALGLLTIFCLWVNPSWFLNLFLIQIQSFWFLLSSWTLCLYKEGYCPLLLYLLLDWFNKISLPFCPEDVGNCQISLNSCVLAFFLLFACSYDWWLYSVVTVLCY